jgi:hypothetical protein
VAEFLREHPGLWGAAFATLGAMFAYTAFRAGMDFAELRAQWSATAREASEALGG